MARYAAYVSTQLGLRISRRLFARLVEDFAYDELSVDEIFAAERQYVSCQAHCRLKLMKRNICVKRKFSLRLRAVYTKRVSESRKYKGI
jgi:hypothetical protein